MSAFTKFDHFERDPSTRTKYVLTKELVWDIGAKGSGWQLVIPAGTKFDISVPRVLEWALNPHDKKVLLAAAVHDELLIRGHDAAFSSSEFRRAAVARGCSHMWAWVLFLTTFMWTVKWRA